MELSEQGAKLEKQAVAMIRQYKFLLPAAAKTLFKDLAEFMGWENLKKEL